MSPPSLRARLDERFRALRHRNFRIYWTCQLTSLVGTWMQSVAQSWLLHRLDPAPLALGQAVMIALVVTAGIVQPWMVYALALVYGLFNAFDLPARQSFLVELAGKEDLPNAIALNSAAFNGARIIGPAVAGLLVAWLP